LVKVKRFYLGKAPITNLQFELFDPSHKQRRDRYSPDDDSPALYVNWYMVVMFCTWLGEQHRLPTEEEWEVACRAGTTTKYWWGDEFASEKCNSAESTLGRATPATTAHANDWGFMEMHGNVWEWCQDEYSPGSGSRVLRGGSFGVVAVYCRSAFRDNGLPVDRNSYFGFRVSRTYP
jgi:formylglycine-generating enzyme required for sulfatase activity